MYFLGDIHGDMRVLAEAMERVDGPLVQVGDFGMTPDNLHWLGQQRFPHPLYFIDGNHEHHGMFPVLAPGPVKLAPNSWYMARGAVAAIEGRRIGFMGGACSIDKAYRLKHGWHWSEMEIVTDDTIDRMVADVAIGGPLDLLVTHTPPESLIMRHFDPMDKLRLFGVSVDWVGAGSSLRIDRLWEALGRPPLVCGHMHRAVIGDGYRMLGVNELVAWQDLALHPDTLAHPM